MNPEQKIDFIEQQLLEHVDNCKERFDRGDQKFDQLVECLNANTQAISHLADETRGVRHLYNDVQATIRIGSSVQKFCLWLLKWGVVGSFIVGTVLWVTKQVEGI